MRSIGLDVGKRFAEVAISEHGRGTRSGGRISATPESLRAFAATLGPDDQVVLEATTNTWPIVEVLERHAGRVVVSNPLRTRAIADAKTKTDTIDAATLAELLPADYLPAVWQPDPETRALRRRVAGRAALVAERIRLRNRISAVLMRNLVASPRSDPFGRNGRSWLVTVELPVDEHELVDLTLRLLDGLEAEIGLAEAGIARAVVDDPRVRRLLSIPGIGLQTAVGLVALVGDIGRFRRTEQACQLSRPSTRSSASRAAGPRTPVTSATPVRVTSGASSSRLPSAPLGCGAHSTRSTGASPAGVVTRSRSSPSPASSPSWPGIS